MIDATVLPFPRPVVVRAHFGLRKRDADAAMEVAREADLKRSALAGALSAVRDALATPPAIAALRRAQDHLDAAERELRAIARIRAEHIADLVTSASVLATTLEADIQDGSEA